MDCLLFLGGKKIPPVVWDGRLDQFFHLVDWGFQSVILV